MYAVSASAVDYKSWTPYACPGQSFIGATMARDIGEWLEGLGLEKYVEIFIENEIGFNALA
jgi:hypothetical protein